MRFHVFHRRFISTNSDPITVPSDYGYTFSATNEKPNAPLTRGGSGVPTGYELDRLIAHMLNVFFTPTTEHGGYFTNAPDMMIDFERPCAAEASSNIQPGYVMYRNLNDEEQIAFHNAFEPAFRARFNAELARWNARPR